MENRGQIGIEYLIIASFVTFIVIGILSIALFFSNSIKDELVNSQVEGFANDLISSSESIFFAGEPSKIEITLFLPKGVSDIYLDPGNSNNLVIETQNSGGTNLRVYKSQVPLIINTISPSEGLKVFTLIATPTGVNIDQVGGT